MAYVFKEGDLPSLIDAKQARERIFFVNQELAKTDDMLAGVMHYKKDAASPLPGPRRAALPIRSAIRPAGSRHRRRRTPPTPCAPHRRE